MFVARSPFCSEQYYSYCENNFNILCKIFIQHTFTSICVLLKFVRFHTSVDMCCVQISTISRASVSLGTSALACKGLMQWLSMDTNVVTAALTSVYHTIHRGLSIRYELRLAMLAIHTYSTSFPPYPVPIAAYLLRAGSSNNV